MDEYQVGAGRLGRAVPGGEQPAARAHDQGQSGGLAERRGGAVGAVAGPGHVEPRGEGVHQVEPVGQAGQEPVDGPDRQESSDSSTTRARTPSAPAVPAPGTGQVGGRRWPGGGARRPPPPGPRRPRAAMASTAAGSSTTHSSWSTPSSSTAATQRAAESVASRAVSPVASERPQMGERLTRVAVSSSRRSLLALGRVSSWGRISADAGLVEAEHAQDAEGHRAVGGGHPVGVEGRLPGPGPGPAAGHPVGQPGGRRLHSGRRRCVGRARAARPGWSWRCAGRPGRPARRVRPRRRRGATTLASSTRAGS